MKAACATQSLSDYITSHLPESSSKPISQQPPYIIPHIHTPSTMSGDGMLKPEKDFSGVLDEQLPEILASAKVTPIVTSLSFGRDGS